MAVTAEAAMRNVLSCILMVEMEREVGGNG
jgi:hypothetical protein